jgi:hypothetical protein
MVQGAKVYATLMLNLCTRTREELGIERKDAAASAHRHAGHGH